jgi:hypothetical protein
MMIRSKYLMMVTVVWLGLALLPAAMAQTGAGEPSSPNDSYSDTELQSFALAVLEVQKINTVYLSRFEAAATLEEQEQVVDAAKKEVAQVIQKQGMSISRFHQILGHTQSDPAFADRVRQLIKEEAR